MEAKELGDEHRGKGRRAGFHRRAFRGPGRVNSRDLPTVFGPNDSGFPGVRRCIGLFVFLIPEECPKKDPFFVAISSHGSSSRLSHLEKIKHWELRLAGCRNDPSAQSLQLFAGPKGKSALCQPNSFAVQRSITP